MFSIGATSLLAAAIIVAGGFVEPAPAEDLSPEAAASAGAKMEQIREAYESGGSFGMLQITELEANSYLAYEFSYALPYGVSEVLLRFEPGRIGGSAVVDFDRLKEGFDTPPNPIADFLLRGVHGIEMEGTAWGLDGTGEFRLERVLFDGVELPRPVIDYMIEQYLLPRYPNTAIDRPFQLPFSIDDFRAGTGYVVLTGKAKQ